jgi:hypothetical protein
MECPAYPGLIKTSLSHTFSGGTHGRLGIVLSRANQSCLPDTCLQSAAMVEAEAPPAVDGPVDEAPAGTTDETSEVPTKPPKRFPKPSKEERDAQVEALNGEIVQRKARMQEISEAIARKRGGGQSPEEEANRKMYSELRAQFKSLLVSSDFWLFTLP